MKTKIFNRLLAAIAIVAISAAAFAQETPVQPPAPPQAPEVTTPKTDFKQFDKKMADLKVKMRDLKQKMKQKNFNANKDMAFAFKDFDKNFSESFKGFDKTFTESFKDFGKNFAGNFSDMAPEFSGAFKNFNGVSYSNSNNLNSDEYKEKLANGQINEKIKNYSKTYSVDGNDVLQISNSFGKIVVNTWAKNEFKVDVQMKFGSDDEDYVNSMINGSSISDSKVGSIVSFKTNLARNNGSNGDNHMEVNYTVYIPAANAVDITNKFGNVILPDLSGKATVHVSYGTLNAQQLLSKDNDIRVRFGDANIVTFNGGKLDVGYGKVKAGTVSNVTANISFAGFSADRLKTSADINIKYGDGFNIGAIDRSVRNLTINASFTKIKLDFKGADSYNFDVVTKLGSFNYNNDNIKVTAKTPSDEDRGWSSTKTYKGYIGKSNSDGKIAINASYTDVHFY
ncbi:MULTISPECIES: hypothetical protein [unclassified Mucilaginibacter]|uniref:hypothetical protein n=1 Tax=unclassified Mucilaginibacter TaxID=2617802 RepID=UPI002AC9468E|nr:MULTISPECIES: hypothetical protein [unclassified Mucilaginibacter]MEB0262119.1 hypothetical protein [Mucilaginibacter sp. 10I4]MEB0279780.1 hypothetical protein [Mucilaginibacter sp. 10B2]MEB0301268.1 hypothetical protein [Mucilaginibacter sp. 5C4]WPX24247.1 hypothetical protein RHM67_03025 [Mucilaginibacter sp. 5C4]